MQLTYRIERSMRVTYRIALIPIVLLQPLGMRDTRFFLADNQKSRLAKVYGVGDDGKLFAETRETIVFNGLPYGPSYPVAGPRRSFSGGGGLCATVGDYYRFCQMLLNRGELDGQRLLGRKTVEYMRLNHLPDNKDMAAMGQPVWSETSYDGIGFGLGFAVVLDPVKAHIITSVGEHHWGGAASTFFWLDPTEELFTVFFTQLMPSSTYPIRRELRTRVYQALVD